MPDVTYFEKMGRENTDDALRVAKEYAQEEGIRSIVVASTTGFTAGKASEIFRDYNLVVVTHVAGLREPDGQEFPADLRKQLEDEGVRVLTTAHAFDGANRLADAGSVGQIIRDTLRMFCEGIKVCVEIAAMAADAGLVRTDEDLISVGGTGRGADTVLVVRPSNSRKLFDTKVRKVLAKPI